MPNRIDSTGEYSGLNEKAIFVLARLGARALEGRALAGIDELDLEECADALEALAWPAPDSLDRLFLWLGPDYPTAHRRARRLREVLEACATIVVCANPAQAGPMMGALQKFAYHLAAVVEGGRQPAGPRRREPSRALVEVLQGRIDALPGGQGLGLALVHCAAVDQVDALRGLRAGEAVVQKIGATLRQ